MYQAQVNKGQTMINVMLLFRNGISQAIQDRDLGFKKESDVMGHRRKGEGQVAFFMGTPLTLRHLARIVQLTKLTRNDVVIHYVFKTYLKRGKLRATLHCPIDRESQNSEMEEYRVIFPIKPALHLQFLL